MAQREEEFDWSRDQFLRDRVQWPFQWRDIWTKGNVKDFPPFAKGGNLWFLLAVIASHHRPPRRRTVKRMGHPPFAQDAKDDPQSRRSSSVRSRVQEAVE